jgi:hypothetical protein
MSCPRCEEAGKPENFGQNRQCAFAEGLPSTKFSGDNWNCVSMDILRKAVWERAVWEGDQACAVLSMPWSDDDEEAFGSFIILSWYKNRGRTEEAWLYEPGDKEPFAPLTLAAVDRFAEVLAERFKR